MKVLTIDIMNDAQYLASLSSELIIITRNINRAKQFTSKENALTYVKFFQWDANYFEVEEV